MYHPGRKEAFKNCITTGSGAFILMLFALYDNFPILTSDTGTYITSGFTLQTPADRPIFYGLFIRLTSLGASLWLTIFFQCLILSRVLIAFIQKLIPGVTRMQLTGFLLFTALFTICGWFAGQLMPDIFTAILILAVTSFLLFPQNKYERIALAAIILLATLMHNGNVMMLALFASCLLLYALFRSGLRRYRSRILALYAISIFSWLAFCTGNWLSGRGFVASSATHVFIMGKLVESGVLKTYLDKACPVKNYRICAYADQLPPVAWEFHWDASSPLQQTGGWEANRAEYNAIIRDIFSRPKYYPYIAYKSLEATARQLVLFNIDGTYVLPWMKFDEETSPYKAIQQYYPHELNELKASRQNTKTLSIPFYDNLFVTVIVLSTVLLLFLMPDREKKLFYRLVCCAGMLMLLNAFTTAVLSSVNPRFMSRVIWIIPFINLIMLFRIIAPMRILPRGVSGS